MAIALTHLPSEELAAYGEASPAAVTFRRRRARVLAALVLLAIALAWGAMRVGAALEDVPASVPERRPGPGVHVVQPGETLWSVARSLQPEGDVRPLVRALIAANGGPEVDVGDRVVLP
jgi:hypothetical protein